MTRTWGAGIRGGFDNFLVGPREQVRHNGFFDRSRSYILIFATVFARMKLHIMISSTCLTSSKYSRRMGRHKQGVTLTWFGAWPLLVTHWAGKWIQGSRSSSAVLVQKSASWLHSNVGFEAPLLVGGVTTLACLHLQEVYRLVRCRRSRYDVEEMYAAGVSTRDRPRASIRGRREM